MSTRQKIFYDVVKLNGTKLVLMEPMTITKAGGVQHKPSTGVRDGKTEVYMQQDFSEANSEITLNLPLIPDMLDLVESARDASPDNILEFSSTKHSRTRTVENASINYKETGESLEVEVVGDPVT